MMNMYGLMTKYLMWKMEIMQNVLIYKKIIEPEIYNAIKYGSVVENVILDEDNCLNYNDTSITENTRYHILYII